MHHLLKPLNPSTEQALRRMNPWWDAKPMQVLPQTRRKLVRQIHTRFQAQIAPIVVVRGSRQVGKTTAYLHVIDDLLAQGVSPKRIIRVQYDEIEGLKRLESPVLDVVAWFEYHILGQSLNEAAQAGEPAFIFLDEVQNLNNWAQQLKSLVDTSTVQILVTGSSALRIEQGKDSLAGRINMIECSVLSLSEIALFRGLGNLPTLLEDNGIDKLRKAESWYKLQALGLEHQAIRDEAFRHFAERGGYPLMHKQPEAALHLLLEQMKETVIERVIQHDLRIGDRGRKRDKDLLEALFRLCARYTGQSPSRAKLAEELRAVLNANVGGTRIGSYLNFLEETLLIRLVQPLEVRLKRQKSGAKICLVDHALRRVQLAESVPLTHAALSHAPETEAKMAGHIVEGIIGNLFITNHLATNHLPERQSTPEVDFVLTIGDTRIPVEVKYRANIQTQRDAKGIRAFIGQKANRASFGIIITRQDVPQPAEDWLIPVSLPTLLMLS